MLPLNSCLQHFDFMHFTWTVIRARPIITHIAARFVEHCCCYLLTEFTQIRPDYFMYTAAILWVHPRISGLIHTDTGAVIWYASFPSGVLCNVEYPPQTHLQLKSRKISFTHNLLIKYPIVLKYCAEHGNMSAVICAKLQIDWATETDAIEERDIAKFEFKMSFGRISYIAQHPGTGLQHKQG